MDRKENILRILQATNKPTTGNDLAKLLGVSRQVIVQDVAILRAQGIDILATPQGYLLMKQKLEPPKRTILAVKHQFEQTQDELYVLVDNKLKVIDVVVEHPIYGELRGYLMLESRADVNQFINNIKAGGASLLSSLTGGVHLHTVEYNNAKDLIRAQDRLAELNLLAQD
ncbi:transcription repressor NadR [Desulfolucanica intricata]|uniref:transcription repressor NadR n=1 Tax=Desulfolucanica intricata TaxID=1285191 RepID=UPI000836E94F|nr:transcription repressor NadR [Desulfolucanica intricata]